MRQSATLTGRPAARRRTHSLLGLVLVLLGLALASPAGDYYLAVTSVNCNWAVNVYEMR